MSENRHWNSFSKVLNIGDLEVSNFRPRHRNMETRVEFRDEVYDVNADIYDDDLFSKIVNSEHGNCRRNPPGVWKSIEEHDTVDYSGRTTGTLIVVQCTGCRTKGKFYIEG